jgi:SsrA-binding protein
LKTYSWYNFEGSEVKSIRASRVSIVEGYCYVNNNELFIKGMHIAECTKKVVKHYNHLPLRDKKLLMKRKEISKLNENYLKRVDYCSNQRLL